MYILDRRIFFGKKLILSLLSLAVFIYLDINKNTLKTSQLRLFIIELIHYFLLIYFILFI